ncbi:glutamate racemase [Amylibacter sp. SFDW26]|uniref:glutamate racemase n=1 Tax=Amylibacter sp. SFDW26 TaxID=2652722 RepID=UPI0012622658|nr:aspartate/glutamate racemase family protein [Amylibacter sp. SFDW26]KAB7615671.1 glutamate racemase [Amylibacter sp. SFDW26]
MPVGVFDSGLGGLTVYRGIQERMPDLKLSYIGDNMHAPYGVRDADDIYNLTCRSVERLWDEGCNLAILACNTATAVACKRMQEEWVPKDKRVLGVFVPLIEALTERDWGDNSAPREVAVKQVALFATPATVASRAFQRELAFRAVGVDVEAQPCAGLVDALEDNDLELAEAMVRSHVTALKRRMPNPQSAILGCTHYPILEHVFQSALGDDVKVFSQANIVAASLEDYLKRHPDMVGTDTEGRFLTTGDPQAVSDAATRFLSKSLRFEAA